MVNDWYGIPLGLARTPSIGQVKTRTGLRYPVAIGPRPKRLSRYKSC